ncbi:uncharacterized protein LOC127527027 isoform X2 [Erpetoichthys calabaricus]|uniref:uncharacterized protein LOC127527027 isoform X1 n=1 Tax=Erpetoichthys calabaricus TaxID=27687 RepID=UPI0022347003|nr:uncharacterized protein LOC127527027 isoform X1 [Erpetoichthys calabaricus]XP_051780476.1 uncharacterized protein LOC127527027 isoform X2 [Erpetoichthys calabaricus]XP_051780477.1 uncharacterized protein LOC127527027 isoform X2 [Erpetoichthys calabaricus]
MPIINSFGPLEMYIDKEEGVALQADNGKYWSCISYDSEDHKMYIEAAKEHKDSWCKFHVSKTSDGKISLQDKRGMYLSRYYEDDIQYIKPVKSSPDECCEFSVFTDDTKILLKADNGMYLSRMYRKHQNIEAAKDGPDECCKFAVSIGDVIEPSFQILNVEVRLLKASNSAHCCGSPKAILTKLALLRATHSNCLLGSQEDGVYHLDQFLGFLFNIILSIQTFRF